MPLWFHHYFSESESEWEDMIMMIESKFNYLSL